jgi:hypothetical protein
MLKRKLVCYSRLGGCFLADCKCTNFTAAVCGFICMPRQGNNTFKLCKYLPGRPFCLSSTETYFIQICHKFSKGFFRCINSCSEIFLSKTAASEIFKFVLL